ncbi:hypothetical protein D3C83_167610 [compost metagenome]
MSSMAKMPSSALLPSLTIRIIVGMGVSLRAVPLFTKSGVSMSSTYTLKLGPLGSNTIR